jgi:hypothetical protein
MYESPMTVLKYHTPWPEAPYVLRTQASACQAKINPALTIRFPLGFIFMGGNIYKIDLILTTKLK